MARERYLPIAASSSIKAKVREIASSNRRSVAAEGAILLELGLAEYERREAERQAILQGKTQIDLEALGRRK